MTDNYAPGVLFGLTGGLIAIITAGIGAMNADGWYGLNRILILVVFSFLIPGILGQFIWSVGTDRVDRFTMPQRGAIAGALTMWLSVGLLVPVVVFVERALMGPIDPADIFVLGGLFLVGLIAGISYVGIIVVPAGFLVGYVLGRKRVL